MQRYNPNRKYPEEKKEEYDREGIYYLLAGLIVLGLVIYLLVN